MLCSVFSRQIIQNLIDFGVEFERTSDGLSYTREGAHSTFRILHHKDITGYEITSKLMAQVQQRPYIHIEDTLLGRYYRTKSRMYRSGCKNQRRTDTAYICKISGTCYRWAGRVCSKILPTIPILRGTLWQLH